MSVEHSACGVPADRARGIRAKGAAVSLFGVAAALLLLEVRLVDGGATEGRLNLRSISWAAGFLEGEGCFFASRKGSATALTRVMGVQAAQVQKWPLDRLSQMFGGSVRPRAGRGRQKDYFCWGLYGPRAAGLTMTLYQFLSPKRQKQIVECLREWRERPPSPKNRATCVNGHPFDVSNTRVMTSPRQRRACRQCGRDSSARWRAKRRG